MSSNMTYRLVLNAGSSSLKFKLFAGSNDDLILSGLAEKIGEEGSRLQINGIGAANVSINSVMQNHSDAMSALVHNWKKLLDDPELGKKVVLVGHREVHGGELFKEPIRISEEVKKKIEELSILAPLHNPANLIGIRSAEEVFPSAVQVAIFDTAFHQTMPDYAYQYAVPEEWYKNHGVRVYGFHGTSHKYVSQQAINYLGLKSKGSKIICLHLGNGCSVSAVQDGQCIDTSMGLSPLGGLVMGTRSGDIDPSLYVFLERKGLSTQEVDRILNKESGLTALAGNNDLRELSKRYNEGDHKAILALTLYTYRIKKYIGSYIAALNGLDALVFTAGVGENSALIRKLVCQNLEALGLAIDEDKNLLKTSQAIFEIQKSNAAVRILVISTDEELEILHQATRLM
jgi:acetate kinase